MTAPAGYFAIDQLPGYGGAWPTSAPNSGPEIWNFGVGCGTLTTRLATAKPQGAEPPYVCNSSVFTTYLSMKIDFAFSNIVNNEEAPESLTKGMLFLP